MGCRIPPPRVSTRLHFPILPQPDDQTCGPTCLQALYRYYGEELPLEQVVREVPQLDDGGTLAVNLAVHALRRGYRARIHTYNLLVFDPTWFDPAQPVDMAARLRAQRQAKTKRKLLYATDRYLEFLELGGEMRMVDLTPKLLRGFLQRGQPILTGLSATWLYRCAREIGDPVEYDDVRGKPTGHFVVLCGYEKKVRRVLVADPLASNPVHSGQLYTVGIDRLIGAILLSIVTYDANLLVITKPTEERR